MAFIVTILMILFGLVSLVCWIMVLIQMFKVQGALHGILGIICGLYAFIWGWMNANELNIKTIMIIWTVCFVVQMGFTGVNMSQAMNQTVSQMPTMP